MGLKLKSSGGTGSVQLNCPDNHNLDTSFTLPTTNVTGGEFVLADGSGNVNIDSGTLYVDAVNNRVGIGTASPVSLLEVENSTGSAAITITASNTGYSELYFRDQASSEGAISFDHNNDSLKFYTGGSTRATIDSSGVIDFVGPGYTIGTNSCFIKQDSSGEGYLYNRGNNDLLFGTNNTERVRIDSSGRLLLNTATGTDKGRLTVTYNADSNNDIEESASIVLSNRNSALNAELAGGIFMDCYRDISNPSYAGGIWFVRQQFAGNASSAADIVFGAQGNGSTGLPAEKMRIGSTGKIEFNPAGAGMYIYNFTNNAGNSTVKYNYSSGLLSYDTSSRLVKENIVDCPYGIEEIKQLQPRKYVRLDGGETEIGFIADEMHEVMPEFAPCGKKSILTKNEEDEEVIPLSVNYDKLTAVLTKALQEAIAKIETLEAKVAALEGGTTP